MNKKLSFLLTILLTCISIFSFTQKQIEIEDLYKKGVFRQNYVFGIESMKDGEHYTFFEVKGSFDYMNMTRIFTLNQKWLYDKWKLYVQLAVVPGIFKTTFTPSRYLLTDKATTNRKISFDIRMLSDYINQISPSKLYLGDTINF